MIRQQDLRAALELRSAREEFERDDVVRLYREALEREKAAMGALRERAAAGEPVQSGRLALRVRESLAISWEKVWQSLVAVPAIAAVIGRDRRAAALVQQAAARDRAAPFVSRRLVVDVVAAPGGAS